MNRPATPHRTWLFDFTAFIAVVVGAIIMISAIRPDPSIVVAIMDAGLAYLAWRFAGPRPTPELPG